MKRSVCWTDKIFLIASLFWVILIPTAVYHLHPIKSYVCLRSSRRCGKAAREATALGANAFLKQRSIQSNWVRAVDLQPTNPQWWPTFSDRPTTPDLQRPNYSDRYTVTNPQRPTRHSNWLITTQVEKFIATAQHHTTEAQLPTHSNKNDPKRRTHRNKRATHLE